MATLKKVVTEDLGKIAEKALCDLLGTPYKMAFGYPQDRVDALRPRFESLKTELAGYTHTGATSNLNDFTSADGSNHLSVKTTKKGYKICPQVLGQPSRTTFCPAFGLPLDATNDQIKTYIQDNVKSMLPKYLESTFHCPVLFYCEAKNLCQMITMTQKPDWHAAPLTFSRQGEAWNESSTLKIGKKTIGEFQIHNHRNCIKFRWDLNGLLQTFPTSFTVRTVS
jgi:hypothetical protein